MRVLRHFARARGVEVCVLQASPLLGAWLGGLESGDLGRFALLVLGSLALTAHVFVFNDWAGYATDVRDHHRAQADIDRRGIALLSAALLVVAAALLAALGTSALLFGAGIAALSLMYSFSPLGKSTPVAASLNHVIGGALHFLLGYSAFHAVDTEGVGISLFFGLVFAAGHLNQEIRDRAADAASGIRTTAVVFGTRRAFGASFVLFSVAYAVLVALAIAGTLSAVMLLVLPVWALQAWWSRQALRRGLDTETAEWMQRRYRLLFAVVGALMVVQ